MITKEKLKLYIDCGMSQKNIAEQENVAKSTVRYWLSKYNLRTEGSLGNRGNHCSKRKWYCRYCGESNRNNFYGNKFYICKRCHNSELYYKRQVRVYTRRHRRYIILMYKGNKCEICKYSKYKSALCLHHINPEEKDSNYSTITDWKSWKEIKIEIDKCILVCRNCHQAIHSGELKGYLMSKYPDW